ncbi:MAG: hypothetical protein ACE5HB_02240 [Terriglobia bacterium]
MICKVGGCSSPIMRELEEQSLCLEHYLTTIQERAQNFARDLWELEADQSLHHTAMQFIMMAAAKLATIGIQSPPSDQLGRGRLLNAMLLLADLRERLDKAGGRPPAA